MHEPPSGPRQLRWGEAGALLRTGGPGRYVGCSAQAKPQHRVHGVGCPAHAPEPSLQGKHAPGHTHLSGVRATGPDPAPSPPAPASLRPAHLQAPGFSRGAAGRPAGSGPLPFKRPPRPLPRPSPGRGGVGSGRAESGPAGESGKRGRMRTAACHRVARASDAGGSQSRGRDGPRPRPPTCSPSRLALVEGRCHEAPPFTGLPAGCCESSCA